MLCQDVGVFECRAPDTACSVRVNDDPTSSSQEQVRLGKQPQHPHYSIPPACRKEMITVLEGMIRARLYPDPEWLLHGANETGEEKCRETQLVAMRRKVSFIARSIEARLHEEAPSADAYSDNSTLRERLKGMFDMLRSRKIQEEKKTSKQSISHKEPASDPPSQSSTAFNTKSLRLAHLRKSVGKEIYCDVMDLVSEIRMVRQTSMLWIVLLEVNDQNGSNASVSKRVSQVLPKSVIDIYIENRLVKAVDDLEGKHQKDYHVSASNWQALIKSARSNLDEFKELEKQRADDLRRMTIRSKGQCFLGGIRMCTGIRPCRSPSGYVP